MRRSSLMALSLVFLVLVCAEGCPHRHGAKELQQKQGDRVRHRHIKGDKKVLRRKEADDGKIKGTKQTTGILGFTATDCKWRDCTKSFECWRVRWPWRAPPKWTVSWHSGGLSSDVPRTLHPQIQMKAQVQGRHGCQREDKGSWEAVLLPHAFPSWTPSSRNHSLPVMSTGMVG